MGKAGLIRFFQEHNRLLEPAALDLILASSSPLDLSRVILESAHDEIIITRTVVGRVLEGAGSPASSQPFELVFQGYLPPVRSQDPLRAYGDLFADRYARLARLLKGKPELKNLVRIHDLPRHLAEEVSIIGMVKEVRSTKNRNLILTVDDLHGEVSVLVPKESPQSKEPFLPDEIVGLRLWVSRDEDRIASVKETVRPGIPTTHQPRKSAQPSRVMFLSDLHVGSKMFLHDSWSELTAFLRGESIDPGMAAEIRHVVIAGDLVDGIGIYPGQERDLAIPDIVEQYTEFGRLIREIPARINIVAIPGNHDAVCPAEPQPPLGKEIVELFPSNVRMVGNPSLFALDGVMVEAYHGRGFDDIIPNLPSASYERPTEVMKRMLSMRHLSPIYGGKIPLAPLPRDGLVVDPIPDILVTGHTHTAGAERYRGVLLLNASAWIGETEYQRMRNVKPSPGQAFVTDLATHSVIQLSFLGGHPKLAQ